MAPVSSHILQLVSPLDRVPALCEISPWQTLHLLQNAKLELADRGFKNLLVPQERPLSAGETLGCTAPRLQEAADALIFVADGRFHLEAMLIANPSLRAYRYGARRQALHNLFYSSASST